ncbi:MAG: GNAT family N-acetyltransferase, partial [Chloroflexota bacterium]
MTQPITITRATADHVDLAAPLFDGYRQFYKQASDLDGCRHFLHERLTRDESVVFLAMMDDKAVGFMQLYPSFSSISIKPLWVLNDLFVAPDARKLGVGSLLLERARQHAVETGAKGLTLSTAAD